MFVCVLCDKRITCTVEVFGSCEDCFDSFELTETSIRKALENLTKDNVDVAPDNLFHEPDLIKVKAVSPKNGNGNGKHTRETVEAALRILDKWKELNNHPDAAASPERLNCIIEQLMGSKKCSARTEADLVKCLLGYSIEPIVVNGKRFDNIKLLFKDADHIEKGIEIAKRSQSQRRSLSSATDGAEQYSDILSQIRNRRR